MEILHPKEIGSKISTLLIDSNKRFIAISPFLKILGWRKMEYALEQALKNDVSVEIYYRETNQKELNYLKSIGVKTFRIDNLHTKLYFNDTSVLMSSMNLYETSDLFTHEIGVLYKDEESYIKFFEYYENHIEKKVIGGSRSDKIQDLTFLSEFLNICFPHMSFRSTESYLFSKDLGEIHLMLSLKEITLKYSVKDPSKDRISYYQGLIDKLEMFKALPSYPSTNYNYMTWSIDIDEKTFEDVQFILEGLKSTFK